MNKEKMKKTAGTVYVIVNILRILLMAVTVIVLIAAAALLFLKEVPAEVFTTSLSLGNVSLQLAEGVVSVPVLQKISSAVLAAASVLLLMSIYGLGIIRNILKPMRDGRPFDTEISVSLRRLGFLVLFGGILSQLLGAAITRYMLGTAAVLQQILKEGVVTGITYRYSFSLEFLITALILFLMSYVFRYGEELQQEVDETL